MKQTYRKTIEDILVTQKKYQDKDFNAKALAALLGMPTYKLSRVMHAEFGMPYPDFVHGLRVKDAQRLLVDKRLASCTIEMIGEMVGFANRISFYLAFRKHVGVSPDEYRNNQRNKG